MAAPRRMTKSQKYLMQQESFRRNAFLIIKKMVELAAGEHPSVLVDEVLHSIFSLGVIKSEPKYPPERIVDNGHLLEELRRLYPQPFELFASQLPRRSPFSCVLDMIVRMKGQNNETEIIEEVLGLLQKLEEEGGTGLVSSAICVSQRNTARDSVRYYGVSMSTSGCYPGRFIVIAASCLNYWDRFIADAVMTYYPEREINPNFNRTIRLPEQVRCQAFSLRDGTPMAPCRSCGNMFGLTTNETNEWSHGNCAEAESLSNLLYGENKIRVQQPHYIDANRQMAVNRLRTYLTQRLREVNFRWDNHFYIPQGN